MARRPREPKHGTASEYNNHACRCDLCREAASLARSLWTVSLRNRTFDEVPHGTVSGYRNWGCRCGPCTAARREEQREFLRRQRERDRAR